jgi:hypothetical protein
VVYGAVKLAAAAIADGLGLGSREAAAGVATAVVAPLPLLAYWAYVLWPRCGGSGGMGKGGGAAVCVGSMCMYGI